MEEKGGEGGRRERGKIVEGGLGREKGEMEETPPLQTLIFTCSTALPYFPIISGRSIMKYSVKRGELSL